MKTPELKKLKEENDVFLFFLFVKKTNSIIQHQVAYTLEKGYNSNSSKKTTDALVSW